MAIDSELNGLARLILVNAFYEEFSGLVNKYMAAGTGLDSSLEGQLSDMSNVYSRDDNAESDESINLWVETGKGRTYGYDTMLEALQDAKAVAIHVNGNKVFERDAVNEWVYVEGGA